MNCFITGANRGIGLEFVKQLSAKGFNVFAAVRNSSEELEKLPNTTICRGLDSESFESIDDFFSSNEFPKMDLIILNAGVLYETPLNELDISLVQKQIQVNALAPLYIVNKLLPLLKEGTKIGIISSLMGSVTDNTSGGYYGYRMSKAALNIAGKSLAVDLKNRGVVVMLLHPGYVKTQMTDFMGNIPPESSVAGLLRVLESSTLTSSGSFYHFKGNVLPW